MPGLSQVWQISGLIVFVPMRKCWDKSNASLGVPGMCLSPLGAMGDILHPPTSEKPGFISFISASAPHPTKTLNHDIVSHISKGNHFHIFTVRWMVFEVVKRAGANRGEPAAASRQLCFDIDPERSQIMPGGKTFLGSSQDAIDMYPAQFLA